MRISPLAGAAATLVISGLALAPPARSEGWQENITLLVEVNGRPSGIAHTYDSEDFQRILLVLEDQEQAYILDLAAATVSAVPRDSLRGESEGLLQGPEPEGAYLALLDKVEGAIRFQADSDTFAVLPLPPLIGEASLESLLRQKPSYRTLADQYRPAADDLAAIRAVDEPTEILVFFGTWCHLCKKLVPPLIRTIESSANPEIRLRLFGVDEDLTQPKETIRANSVSKTPTILVVQKGREVGRIEEKAEVSIERDIARILRRKP